MNLGKIALIDQENDYHETDRTMPSHFRYKDYRNATTVYV